MVTQLSQLPSPQPLNWIELNQERKVIKRFFKSLSQECIQGAMAFNKDSFVLEPRGWFKQGGRFTAIQSGFILLNKKIETLKVEIESFDPAALPKCPREVLTFFYGLRKIQAVVESKSGTGLIALCNNYTSQNKVDKAGSLKKLGESAFAKLNDITQLLEGRITPYFEEELAIDSKLQKLLLPIASHMRKSGECLINLGNVTWTPEEGVCVPRKLIREWFRDASLPIKYSEFTGAAYQNAANLIQVSQTALPMVVQNGVASWVPLRPSCQKGVISLVEEKDGVTGTYERKMGAKDLCNVYFRTTDGCISTSAIDTPLKAQEMSAVILHVLESINHPGGRWILHQLNSFFNEAQLIKDVHKYMTDIEERVKLEKPKVTLLHINTPFNAATKYPWEDVKSVNKINIDSLAQLALFAMEDVDELLNLSGKLSPEWGVFQKGVADVLRLALKIKELKKEKNQPKKEKDQPLVNTNASSSADLSVTDSGSEESVMQEDGTIDDSEGLFSTDSDSSKEEKDTPPDLLMKQSELRTALRTFHTHVCSLIHALPAIEEDFDQANLQKGLLILEVFKTILALQLGVKEKPALSRCCEVELFLLLDRLLNIKRIISCYSGLDRTNTVVAMDDSLECLFESFKQFHLTQLADNQNRDRMAEAKAYGNLFELIFNMDANRAQLIDLGNASLKEVPTNYVVTSIEMKEMQEMDERIDLRGKIIQKIDQLHVHPFNPDILKNTLIYLELMTKHLMTTQIKTFFSTGLLGYRWHWESWVVSNPHPKQRLTQFISSEGQYVQLTYHETYLYDSVTTAAIQILSRLSYMRSV